MNLLSIENISKSYSEKVLIDDVSLGINEGDKIGIIGVNGTGKSTFLKIIAGLENQDSGNIIIGNNVKIGYLPQNPKFDNEKTVIEQIFMGDSPIMVVLRAYEKTLHMLNLNPEDEKLQKKLMTLSSKMDVQDAWEAESEAKSILTKLGVHNFQAKITNLSGGQKKRVALASVLITPSELLILDEPTNHLDDETISWLEQFLNKRKGALLMVTHDRYFLDRITNRIIELDMGKFYGYKGNYSIFLEKKAERMEILSANESKRKNLLRKELSWIKRGAKARSTKQKARIQRFEELSENKEEVSCEKLDLSTASTRLGKKVINLDKVSKSFDGKTIIKDFNYIVLRNDRIGIIGPNGIGKSTLMNLIYGSIESDSGEIEKGETVKIGYYCQGTEHMNNDTRVIDYIKETAEFIETASGEKISASKMLEQFMFPPLTQYTPIGRLSGGEKRRLYLLKVLMESPNVLLLDEPTNDLDIQTLTILEDYLEDFNGAMITVSHDRYFLDKVAGKIFVFEGNGIITQYTGNYTEYNEMHNKAKKDEEVKKNEKLNKKLSYKNKAKSSKEKAPKFSYKEQREFDEIDSVIESLENEISEIEDKINSAGSDYELLEKLLSDKKELESQLQAKMDRWEYLNELAEKIEEYKNNKKLK